MYSDKTLWTGGILVAACFLFVIGACALVMWMSHKPKWKDYPIMVMMFALCVGAMGMVSALMIILNLEVRQFVVKGETFNVIATRTIAPDAGSAITLRRNDGITKELFIGGPNSNEWDAFLGSLNVGDIVPAEKFVGVIRQINAK